MSMPAPIAEFLGGKRIAVAGVSRQKNEAANAIYRKLQGAGYDVLPVNPQASQVEGAPCYPDLAAVPGKLDGVVIVTRPEVSVQVVRECAELGIPRVWLHRSLDQGSVSQEAVRECAACGIGCIAGGCPLMFVPPVDFGHRCLRWWLTWRGRLPR